MRQIRRIQAEDASEAAELSRQLGYPCAVDVMAQRIARSTGSDDHVALVACEDGTVVGWIDVSIGFHLQSGSYGEIGGLVVSTHYRNAGIGKELVAAAEKWVRAKGATSIVVRSQVVREDAHRFYLREGYERVKTSAVFRKLVP